MKPRDWLADILESDERAFRRFQETRVAYQRGFLDGHEMGFSEGKVIGDRQGWDEGCQATKEIYEPLIH